jgi:hypothetical protein
MILTADFLLDRIGLPWFGSFFAIKGIIHAALLGRV